MSAILARRRFSRRIAGVEAVVVREASHDCCLQSPLDRRLSSNEESACRASLSIDVESSNNVAVDGARVGERHVRRGEDARRDRIA